MSKTQSRMADMFIKLSMNRVYAGLTWEMKAPLGNTDYHNFRTNRFFVRLEFCT